MTSPALATRSGAVKRYVVSQFRKPRGLLGRAAGWSMSHRDSNRRRNRWTVGLMQIAPSDRVLEIGFGPGFALGLACDRIVTGHVVGLDHSKTMLEMARAKNRDHETSARLHLCLGSAERLDELEDPFLKGPFEHIFGANVSMFWQEPVRVLASLHARLAPGGRAYFTYQPRTGAKTDEAALATGQRLAEQMRDAGFSAARIETLMEVSPIAVCVIGEV